MSLQFIFRKISSADTDILHMVDDLQLKRFGSCIDDERDQQVFILDFSFNPELTDELLVVYFNLEKEVVEIAHES